MAVSVSRLVTDAAAVQGMQTVHAYSLRLTKKLTVQTFTLDMWPHTPRGKVRASVEAEPSICLVVQSKKRAKAKTH